MRRIIYAILFLLIGNGVQAQQPLSVGEKQVNIGTGFSGFGVPLFVGLDYCFKSNLTVGGEISFRNYNYNKVLGYRQNIFGLGLNVNYHFNELFELPSEWNVYGGATVGYFIYSNSGTFAGGGTSGIGIGLQAGARYFFTQKFGVLVEANGGYSIASGKIGVTFKL